MNVGPGFEWFVGDNEGAVADHLKVDIMRDMTDLLPDLFKTYRTLVYTGDFDIACGFMGTEEILNAIDYEYKGKEGKEWKDIDRYIWAYPPPLDLAKGHPTHVCGYVKELGNLMQIAIPGSGHTVPANKPKVSRMMLHHWIHKIPFPGYFPGI